MARHVTITTTAERAVKAGYDVAGAVGVDCDDPASLMERAEEAAENPPPPERSDIASLLMAYLFHAGPHPEHVTHRLYKMAAVVHPVLMKPLPLAERIVLHASDDAAREVRVSLLLRGTRIKKRKPAAHEQVVRSVLAEAWDRQRRLMLAPEVPESALTDYAADRQALAQFAVQLETVQGLLEFFFREGSAPETVVPRVFMVAKAYFEPLVLRMSLQQLARMFGQTRAAWSWRGKKKLNGFMAARGVSSVKAPYQKSDAVCVKYAAAATGNRNRATGRRCA